MELFEKVVDSTLWWFCRLQFVVLLNCILLEVFLILNLPSCFNVIHFYTNITLSKGKKLWLNIFKTCIQSSIHWMKFFMKDKLPDCWSKYKSHWSHTCLLSSECVFIEADVNHLVIKTAVQSATSVLHNRTLCNVLYTHPRSHTQTSSSLVY